MLSCTVAAQKTHVGSEILTCCLDVSTGAVTGL